MDDFVLATNLEPLSENRWVTTLRKDWALWGPAGGYLTGLALRAAGEATEFNRPVSLSCHFLRVAKFEQVVLDVQSLRSGRRSEILRVDMSQGDKLIFTATVWVADEGNTGMEHDYTEQLNIPPPETLKSNEELYPDRPMHPFMKRFEQRPTDPIPEGDVEPRAPQMTGWYRFRPRATANTNFIDAIRPILLLDTFSWLATYPAHPASGPSPWIAPNLDYYYRFHRTTINEEWLYMKNNANIAHDCLIAADGEIRNLKGQLLVTGSSQLLCSPRPSQFK